MQFYEKRTNFLETVNVKLFSVCRGWQKQKIMYENARLMCRDIVLHNVLVGLYEIVLKCFGKGGVKE